MSESRAYRADLEIRGDGRTVAGLAVPFDAPTEIGGTYGFIETFRRGAFAKTIAERGPERVKFLAQHDDKALPVGRATVLREDANGLYAELRVSKTQAGDEILELIRDQTLDGLSIGFSPIPAGDRWSPDRRSVTRTEVRLQEISAVAWPAYEAARVLAVRSAFQPELLSAMQALHNLRK